MIIQNLVKTIFISSLALTQLISVSYAEDSKQQQLEELQQQLDKLKLQINALTDETRPAIHGDNELTLSGFFDITAHTTDHRETPFEPGALELDIVYDKAQNFAISSALVWTEDGAEVGVAFLDYHIHDHTIPVRGNLYEDPGFHVQLGRFDIPFANDYNYFAAPDRTNVTAPLTTDRILQGGLNGDGMRIYGATASGIESTLFWTNSLTRDNGSSVGSRIGFSLNDNYTLGVSIIHDLDTHMDSRTHHLALDMALRMGITELSIEAITLENDDQMMLGNGTPTGPADESGYHVSLVFDIEPVTLFLRYEEWKPDYSAIADPDDPVNGFNVTNLERLTLAGRYILDEYLYFKIEYYNYLGTETGEPDFDERKLSIQMVASF